MDGATDHEEPPDGHWQSGNWNCLMVTSPSRPAGARRETPALAFGITVPFSRSRGPTQADRGP